MVSRGMAGMCSAIGGGGVACTEYVGPGTMFVLP
jgi:hypothetical protein